MELLVLAKLLFASAKECELLQEVPNNHVANKMTTSTKTSMKEHAS